ncbi:ArsR/SmtB family transcription factor [Gorillibacterium timonense]|uniref:ArsR/SmtB family transcription factor n=1 Tax=Gorillibacterium timonense TaxID=1689269 RepID=UPI000D52A56C|nr:helix-turn-helix domain-containing protein [Gorillibacterium timonense]
MSIKILSTIEEFKAISDPYRMQIIQLFGSAKKPQTVSELAVQLGDSPAKVHYHIKKLEKAGIVSIVETKEVNGILAKYYRPTAESFHVDKDLGLPPGQERQNAIQDTFLGITDTFRKDWVRRYGDKEVMGEAQYTMLSLSEAKAEELRKRLSDLVKEYTSPSDEEKSDQRYYQLFTSFFGEKTESEETEPSGVEPEDRKDASMESNRSE